MEQAQDEKTDMLMTTSVDCQVEQGGWQDQLVAQLSKEGGSLLSLINGCSNVNVALVSLGTPFVSLKVQAVLTGEKNYYPQTHSTTAQTPSPQTGCIIVIGTLHLHHHPRNSQCSVGLPTLPIKQTELLEAPVPTAPLRISDSGMFY